MACRYVRWSAVGVGGGQVCVMMSIGMHVSVMCAWCAGVCDGAQVCVMVRICVHVCAMVHNCVQVCVMVRNDVQVCVMVRNVLQVWSVHIPCAAQYRNGVQLLLEQVDAVRRMIAASGGTELVTTPAGGCSWCAAGHDSGRWGAAGVQLVTTPAGACS